MIELNYSLRVAYKTALTGIANVPVFYQAVPPDQRPQEYIVFRSINSTDISTKNSSDTDTTVVVEIHTYSDVVNSGLSADAIAREVFNRIYANTQFNLSIDGGQIVHTKMQNDQTFDYTNTGGRSYISRFITFKHTIFQTGDIS